MGNLIHAEFNSHGAVGVSDTLELRPQSLRQGLPSRSLQQGRSYNQKRNKQNPRTPGIVKGSPGVKRISFVFLLDMGWGWGLSLAFV